MRLPRAVAAVALGVAVAEANTEATIFQYAGSPDEGAASGGLAPLAPVQSQFSFADAVLESVSLPVANASRGRYLARVCWPASHPADFSIEYDAAAQAVVIVASQADVVALRGGRHAVPFDVHLSPMKYGFIPEDVIPAIQSISVLALAASGVAYFIIKNI